MTVSVELNKNRYTANGSLKTFAYTFKIFEDSDLTVILTDTDGNETTKTLNDDYTVTNAGNESGGNVVFGTAPTNAYTVTLWGTYDFLQETAFEEGDSMPAETLESTFDKGTMVDIYLKELGERCIRIPVSEGNTDMELPPLADRVNKYAGFDSEGNLIATTFSSEATTYMDNLIQTIDDTQEFWEALGLDDGNGNLTITGTLTAADLHLTDDLIVADDVIFGDQLTVSGTTTTNNLIVLTNATIPNILGSVDIQTNLTVGSDLHVEGNAYMGNDLTVSGVLYADDIQATDDLTIGDDLHVEGSAFVAEDLTVTGTLYVDDIIATDDLTVGDDLHVEGSLWVKENATVSGIIYGETDAHITNDIFGGHDLFLTRNATITGTLDVEANYGSDVLSVGGSNTLVGPSDDTHIDVNYTSDTITVYSGTTIIAHFTETSILLNADTVISGSLTLDAGVAVNEFSSDGTMGGNSDSAVPTEQAVVEYLATVSGALSAEIDADIAAHHAPTSADHDDRYYTESEIDTISGSLSSEIDSDVAVVDAKIDTASGTLQAEIDALDFYTTAQVDTISGALSSEIDSDISTHEAGSSHDSRYYTETELDNGQLDNRYYTESEVDTISGACTTYADAAVDAAVREPASGSLQIGTLAGDEDTGLSNNTLIGNEAGRYGEVGGDNTFVGYKAGRGADTTGGRVQNTAVGALALDAIDTGDNNVAIGYSSGGYINSGSDNIAIGAISGHSTTDGNNNVCIGKYAGIGFDGDDNVIIGYQDNKPSLGPASGTGSRNILIGENAGHDLTHYEDDQFRIETSTHKLMDGDMAAQSLTINAATTITGTLYLGDPTVSGSFRFNMPSQGTLNLDMFNGSTWDNKDSWS